MTDTVSGRTGRDARFTTITALQCLLYASVVAAFALVVRPSVPIALILLIPTGGHLFLTAGSTPNLSVIIASFRASAPFLVLFLAVALITTFTAYAPKNHLMYTFKVLLFQFLVVGYFSLGRLLKCVDIKSLMNWMFATLIVSTMLVIEEGQWFLLRNALFPNGPFTSYDGWILNRAHLLLAIAVMFFLVAGWDKKNRTYVWGSFFLLALSAAVTHSESTQLVAVLALLFLPVRLAYARTLLTLATVAAIALMIFGPFLYDHLLKFWEASALGEFRAGTFQLRVAIWAEFSSLVLHDNFWGHGLNASKLIATYHDLYPMPYGIYAWHPHNAGLEIATDLGWPGIIWFSLLLLRLRTFLLNLTCVHQRGLVAVILVILTVSFIADGLWQTWWWFTIAMVAFWIGLLCANTQRDAIVPAH